MVCGYTLGSGCVTYYFQVTVTLTSDLISRKIVSRAILFEVGIPCLICGYTLRSGSVVYCLLVTVTLTLGLDPLIGVRKKYKQRYYSHAYLHFPGFR